MQYVICYDIADDHRRGRLAQTLLDFGPRIQESVFVANLDDELRDVMIGRVKNAFDSIDDRIHIFALCSSCANRTLAMGQAEVVRDEEFYVI